MADAERRRLRDTLRRQARGETLTQEERRVVESFRRSQKKQLGELWKHVSSISVSDWSTMSGVDRKQLRDQAERYGIPFGRSPISLPEVLQAFHAYVADRSQVDKTIAEDPVLAGPVSPGLEKIRFYKARLAEMDVQEREGKLIDRDKLRGAMEVAAASQRHAGELLARVFGEEARSIHEEGLLNAKRAVLQFLDTGDVDGDSRTESAP